jgi:hypothetical protein
MFWNMLGCEVLAVLLPNIKVFWDVRSCSFQVVAIILQNTSILTNLQYNIPELNLQRLLRFTYIFHLTEFDG